MRIGLNLLFMLPGELAGIATYATELVRALARLDDDNQYYLFMNKETEGHLKDVIAQRNFQAIVCKVRASFRPARLLWEQLVLPLQLKRYHIDLVHSLGYFSPLLLPCRSVTTIHDLNFIYARSSFSRVGYLTWRLMVPLSARRSDKIITVSESSKRDIVSFFDLAPERVRVIYEAVPDIRLHWCNQDSVAFSQYGIRDRPILTVASSHPHKNLTRLMEAYSMLARSCRIENQLVLVGHRRAHADLLEEMVQRLNLEEKVILSGYVPDAYLKELYSKAILFVFPSLYEGFGIPILEAMVHGVPVVCSEVASLPEVAGDAALFFDPYNVRDIAEKIYGALQNLDLRQELIRKGYENVKRFSWQQTAHQTIAVYKELCNGSEVVPV